MKDFVSVIFTTYNQPKWLEKVLWGFEEAIWPKPPKEHRRHSPVEHNKKQRTKEET
jgi:hypothetical protein